MIKHVLSLLLLSTLAGCASPRYQASGGLGDPPSRLIKKQPLSLAPAPVEVTATAIEDRVIVRVYNRTSSPLEIDPDGSRITRPDATLDNIERQTIAPGDFYRVTLPPTAISTTPLNRRPAAVSIEGTVDSGNYDQPGYIAGRRDMPQPAAAGAAPGTTQPNWRVKSKDVIRVDLKLTGAPDGPIMRTVILTRE